MFARDATETRFELSADMMTIGRGDGCELRLADERISARHCRLSRRGEAWWIEDLGSTNRTFVNDEPLADQPHRLRHGDLVRLGKRDASLFEARFVLHKPSEQHRAAAQQVAEGVHRRNGELEAQLAARDAEIARLGAMCKRLQAQLTDGETAATAARRAGAVMTAELDELRSQLAIERGEHAACRDQRERAQRRGDELEAQLAAQARQARRDHDDDERGRKDLESRLRLAESELATARAALAVATDNVRALQQAHSDALLQLGAVDRVAGHDRNAADEH